VGAREAGLAELLSERGRIVRSSDCATDRISDGQGAREVKEL
jgi:hypothetical protein